MYTLDDTEITTIKAALSDLSHCGRGEIEHRGRELLEKLRDCREIAVELAEKKGTSMNDSFDIGGCEDTAYDEQRALHCSYGFSQFFTQDTPTKVLEFMDKAERMAMDGQRFEAERILYHVLALLISTKAEHGEIEVGRR